MQIEINWLIDWLSQPFNDQPATSRNHLMIMITYLNIDQPATWTQLIRYARVCSKYEDFLFRGSILVSKVIKTGILFTETSDYTLRKFYGRHQSYRPCSQIWHLCVTYVEGFVHQLWHKTGFPVILSESWRVPHMRQEMLTFPEHLISLPLGSSWFHPFIINIYIHYRICLRTLVLFSWISLTALYWTYYIIYHTKTSQINTYLNYHTKTSQINTYLNYHT